MQSLLTQMKMEINVVKNYLENMVTFITPFLPLANCHMVDFFTNSTYEKYIPADIRTEMEARGLENSVNRILENDYSDLPKLQTFVARTRELTLSNCDRICYQTSKFLDILKSWGCENIDTLKLNRFMTSKKSHEVEILSPIAAAISQIGGVSHLIDIGDGKGYLSSMLSFHHKMKVLGVDAMQINTHGAVKRATRLSKAWNSIIENPEHKASSKEDMACRLNLYKQITQFVDQETDFKQLVENVFLEKPTNLGIVGLHTCGNLGPSSVKLFSVNEHIKTICNVSCCYHLLTEQFEEDDTVNKLTSTTWGFPMSNYLEEKKLVLGRRARMISAQSVDRIMDKQVLPSIHILFRALLQLILEERCTELPTKRVGRIKKCDDFINYTRRALSILEVNIHLSDEEIVEYFNKYKDRMTELHAFYLVRSMLASVIESIILLDRLLFLLERGFNNSFLVQLFDPVVSPRCYGLISVKDDVLKKL